MRANVYPVPDPELPFLGAHLTRGSDGAVLLGPSALIVGARDAYRPSRLRAADLRDTLAWPGTWRMLARFWRAGLTELRRAASQRAFVAEARRLRPRASRPAISSRPGRRPRPGARARRRAASTTSWSRGTGRALHVRNAPSPAATSSLRARAPDRGPAEPLLD